MIVYDFEYDGIRLQDLGFMIGSFDKNGLNSNSSGSEITFNKVKTFNGNKYELTSSTYETCLTTTFSIIKNVCNYHDDMEISVQEYRKLMRWLNRKKFCKFRILTNEYADVYFNGSFNISKIELDGKLYGLELTLNTDKSFAYLNERKYVFEASSSSPYVIYDESDEIGFIYPKMKISILSDCDFIMSNSMELNRNMVIKNCKSGEDITIEYPMISSSFGSHKIYNDFNWVFFRISNEFDNRKNIIHSSDAKIELEYSPIAKVSI